MLMRPRQQGLAAPQRFSGKNKAVDKKTILNRKSGGVAIAASAVVAAAWHEIEHRSLSRAELKQGDLRVERLRDLTQDAGAMAVIDQGLQREWGPFAFVGFESLAELARRAGRNVFIVSRVKDGTRTPRGCLQLTFADVGGDPAVFAQRFPTFDDLTGREAWSSPEARNGDTAVLLQLTVFGQDERGSGLGSLLRNALLHLLPATVQHAITMTPVDPKPGARSLDIADQATWTPAMRFHARGGALPVAVLPGYKAAPEDGGGHGQDIVVMRYSRDADGSWPAERPEMRVRLRGPLQDRAARFARRLKSIYQRRRHRRTPGS
jgi:hypothetical protein